MTDDRAEMKAAATRSRGLGSLPRPKLQPGAIHALLWMLYMAEVTQYGLPHQLTANGWVTPAPLPPVQPCTCPYLLVKVAGAPGPWITLGRPGIHRRELLTAAFLIDPDCEHHGDLRRVEYFDATYLDVLDEDERRDH